MTNEELKNKALRNLVEEHLWKIGESDTYHLGERVYELERIEYGFRLSVDDDKHNVHYSKDFPNMGRCYYYLFNLRGIKL